MTTVASSHWVWPEDSMMYRLRSLRQSLALVLYVAPAERLNFLICPGWPFFMGNLYTFTWQITFCGCSFPKFFKMLCTRFFLQPQYLKIPRSAHENGWLKTANVSTFCNSSIPLTFNNNMWLIYLSKPGIYRKFELLVCVKNAFIADYSEILIFYVWLTVQFFWSVKHTWLQSVKQKKCVKLNLY